MAEEKSLVIVAPEGYEIDKEKSTFDKIVFKKKEEEIKSYEDIAKKLFCNKTIYYTDRYSDIIKADGWFIYNLDNENNAPTKEQLEWILALNKLRNTALVLNDGWKPDWSDESTAKFMIFYEYTDKIIGVYHAATKVQFSSVYFKTAGLAYKAIELLGEETIKTALGVYLVD